MRHLIIIFFLLLTVQFIYCQDSIKVQYTNIEESFAAENYEQCIKLAKNLIILQEESKEEVSIKYYIKSLDYLGASYKAQGKYKLAFDTYQKSVEEAKEKYSKNHYFYEAALVETAVLAYHLHRRNLAQNYLEQAIDIAKYNERSFSNTYKIATLYYAKCLVNNESYKQSKKYFDKCTAFMKKELLSENYKGLFLIGLGDYKIRQENISDAIINYEKALALVKKNKWFNKLEFDELFEKLFTAYEKTGNEEAVVILTELYIDKDNNNAFNFLDAKFKELFLIKNTAFPAKPLKRKVWKLYGQKIKSKDKKLSISYIILSIKELYPEKQAIEGLKLLSLINNRKEYLEAIKRIENNSTYVNSFFKLKQLKDDNNLDEFLDLYYHISEPFEEEKLDDIFFVKTQLLCANMALEHNEIDVLIENIERNLLLIRKIYGINNSYILSYKAITQKLKNKNVSELKKNYPDIEATIDLLVYEANNLRHYPIQTSKDIHKYTIKLLFDELKSMKAYTGKRKKRKMSEEYFNYIKMSVCKISKTDDIETYIEEIDGIMRKRHGITSFMVYALYRAITSSFNGIQKKKVLPLYEKYLEQAFEMAEKSQNPKSNQISYKDEKGKEKYRQVYIYNFNFLPTYFRIWQLQFLFNVEKPRIYNKLKSNEYYQSSKRYYFDSLYVWVKKGKEHEIEVAKKEKEEEKRNKLIDGVNRKYLKYGRMPKPFKQYVFRGNNLTAFNNKHKLNVRLISTVQKNEGHKKVIKKWEKELKKREHEKLKSKSDSLYIGKSSMILGAYYFRENNTEKAKKYYNLGLQILKEETSYYGFKSWSNFMNSDVDQILLLEIVDWLFKEKKESQALAIIENLSFEKLDELIPSEETKKIFFKKKKDLIDKLLSILYRYNMQQKLPLQIIYFLDSDYKAYSSINTVNMDYLARYYSSNSNRQKYKKLTKALNSDSSLDKEKVLKKLLELEKKLLENVQVSNMSSKFEVNRTKLGINSVSPNSAYIDYFNFKYDLDDDDYYFAIIWKDATLPKVVFLDSKTNIEKTISMELWGHHTGFNRGVVPTKKKKGSKGQIYNLLWKPFEEELRGIDTIYYTPSGTLFQLPFISITTPVGDFLGDKYNLFYETKIITKKIKHVESRDFHFYLFGGLDYNLLRNPELDISYKIGYSFFETPPIFNKKWKYLKGTLEEVKSIEKIFHKTGIDSFHIYTRELGTETQFKSLSSINHTNVIHLATHGFYFSNSDEANSSYIYAQASSPYARTGLVLSEGNEGWLNNPIPDNGEDGILLASEISQLDLSNTKLAVLSACETGLGDVQGEQGVFGLQRAFKLAGVNHLITSLWNIPDNQTKELMEYFYKNWLENKMDIKTAFRYAQRQMKDKYDNPYFWAGFVFID